MPTSNRENRFDQEHPLPARETRAGTRTICMIQPDSGLPKMPDTGIADMNTAMIFARRCDGNQ